jgi:hypothetical protein
MHRLFVVFLIILISCGSNGNTNGSNVNFPPKFEIELPEGYEIEEYEQGYNLLTASKYVNGEIEGMIELRYSDDWSFSEISNDMYIKEALTTDKFEKASSSTFNNFKIQIKEKMYFKNLGDCFYSIYSGDYYSNDVRVTNVVIQFVKDDKLYTLIGSSFPENFSNNHKQFLKSFETLKL